MKKRLIGLVLLVAVMVIIGGIYIYKGAQSGLAATTVSGYLGGEKIGFFEDKDVQKILKDKYQLKAEYAKAGSLDMVTADLEGKDYLFPSSSIALEYYEDLYGKPAQSEIILNTPIVLYTHKNILEAFVQQGLITTDDGVNYIDMNHLVDMIQADTQWSDVSLPELYGKISVDTTDPAKSNSGNMFAALMANVLNNGETLTQDNLSTILPKLQNIFGKLGYMETSSADLFSQFLKMGVGAKPIIAGYESQLIEYALQSPDDYENMKDDIVILYPAPTVWSTHVMIALDDNGKALLRALLDEDIQQLAWEKHGFRTGSYDITTDAQRMPVAGIAGSITQVTQIPAYDVMKQIIDGL